MMYTKESEKIQWSKLWQLIVAVSLRTKKFLKDFSGDFKQIGIDLSTLPEVDGFKQLIVCIGYFSKWSQAKAVKDKSAPTVAKFLYEIICRHGCMRVQINDQGKEFVNEVSENLHDMTGTEQRITSAHHPQSNGLC